MTKDLATSSDFAYSSYVTWPREKCATCSRELPKYYVHDGNEQKAWIDEEIGGVFCIRCYWAWKEHVSTAAEKLFEDMEPFAAQVLRALIRLGGQLDISKDEHLHRVIGSLNIDEYESSPIWKKRRDAFVASRPRPLRCELCFSANKWTGYEHVPIKINVHHKTYDRTACELDEDLALLCEECHLVVHKPWLPAAQAQFQRLSRDRDDIGLITAIGALLHRPGWGPVERL